MIPKIIHYCWFGNKKIPRSAKKCINSWKKYLSDYEIIEWNESNYNFSDCIYAKQAYENKKYAFVSDYARFDILYKYGGIYFDVDVEVLKEIDPIIKQGNFMAIESSCLIAAGLGLAFEKENPVIKEILDSYKKSNFIDKNGNMDLSTVVVRVSDIFIKKGFVREDKFQKIENINIFPSEYFCPKNIFTAEIKITNNTYTIHHYDSSWYGIIQKAGVRIFWLIQKLFGKNAAIKFRNIVKNRVGKK